ncbi:MAG: fibrillarin-like rRNA/tRNA 2'-O-methyltransferase [Candidatus Micrarchaeia archaeon]
MEAKQLFDGVFKIEGKLATRNLVPGNRVYGEELININGVEYRTWNPYRSKLAAAILKGLKELRIRPGSTVLYLGAATGTTCSHVSDIIGKEGLVYCVEISERSMRDLVLVCDKRQNMLPILQDAMNIEAYAKEVGKVDVIYQDVSSRMQAEILLRNASLLKQGGYAYVAIKSQSISSSKNPKEVFSEFLGKIKRSFETVESIDISPYSLLHLFAVLRKR